MHCGDHTPLRLFWPLTKQRKSVQFHALMEEYFIHLDTCNNPLASVTTALRQNCCLTRLIGQIVDF